MVWVTEDGKEFSSKSDAITWELTLHQRHMKTKYLKKDAAKTIKKRKSANIEDKYTQYLFRATQKNRDFDFTREEFEALIALDCEYCGKPKSNTLDRIDSKLGYTWNNVKPACWTCNRMKYDFNLEDFYNHISKILCYRDNNKS